MSVQVCSNQLNKYAATMIFSKRNLFLDLSHFMCEKVNHNIEIFIRSVISGCSKIL